MEHNQNKLLSGLSRNIGITLRDVLCKNFCMNFLRHNEAQKNTLCSKEFFTIFEIFEIKTEFCRKKGCIIFELIKTGLKIFQLSSQI